MWTTEQIIVALYRAGIDADPEDCDERNGEIWIGPFQLLPNF